MHILILPYALSIDRFTCLVQFNSQSNVIFLASRTLNKIIFYDNWIKPNSFQSFHDSYEIKS